MHQAIKNMLDRYSLTTVNEYENALKEIIQHVVLLGLWRSDFYIKSAFYGGSALRILYGMDRFSEDLDFTLLKPGKIKIEKCFGHIENELEAFGFKVEIEKKEKKNKSQIESAFVKANTAIHLLQIEAPEDILWGIHKQKKIKIKLEIDIDPPGKIEWENKYILEPIPFNVPVVTTSFMFAGKIHAILYRKWKNRVKGRDWYDMVWFVSQKIPVNLEHLKSRINQSENLNFTHLTSEIVKKEIINTINKIDIEQMKNDVLPFIKNSDAVRVWSKDFFKSVVKQIKFE